jgi:hypothetical protein
MDGTAGVGLGGAHLAATRSSTLAPDSLAQPFGFQFGAAVDVLSVTARADNSSPPINGYGASRHGNNVVDIQDKNISDRNRCREIIWSSRGDKHGSDIGENRTGSSFVKAVSLENNGVGRLGAWLRVRHATIDMVSITTVAVAQAVGSANGGARGISQRNPDALECAAEFQAANLRGNTFAVRLRTMAANNHAAAAAGGNTFSGRNSGVAAT